MSSFRTTLVATAALLCVLSSTALPLEAADINDLNGSYSGYAHSNTNAEYENEPFTMSSISRSSGGKFTGLMLSVPISGKVTSSGKVTFAGKRELVGGTLQIKSGKGQLSATGRFIVGSFSIVIGSDVANVSGKYTFEVDAEGVVVPE